jgi:AraC-like DNA-binding protein
VDLLWFDGALVIAGPDRQAKIEHVPPGKMVVGLQFCPGAAANWLRAPVSDVTDARVPLEHFWGRDVRHLAEWVGQEPTPEKIAQRLEEALLHRLSGIATLDRLPLAMFRIVAETQSSSPPVMCRLSRALDLSARTLRRRALDAFGYGPKTLDRILRFQRFLQLAATDTASSLAELAVAAGYADQPHLTRETSRLASFTPDALRTELSR